MVWGFLPLAVAYVRTEPSLVFRTRTHVIPNQIPVPVFQRHLLKTKISTLDYVTNVPHKLDPSLLKSGFLLSSSSLIYTHSQDNTEKLDI